VIVGVTVGVGDTPPLVGVTVLVAVIVGLAVAVTDGVGVTDGVTEMVGVGVADTGVAALSAINHAANPPVWPVKVAVPTLLPVAPVAPANPSAITQLENWLVGCSLTAVVIPEGAVQVIVPTLFQSTDANQTSSSEPAVVVTPVAVTETGLDGVDIGLLTDETSIDVDVLTPLYATIAIETAVPPELVIVYVVGSDAPAS
jgi:hypothetical protein